jgi:hypothetical protein
MKKNLLSLLMLLSLLFVAGCGEEQFAERTKSTKYGTQDIVSSQSNACANMTLIKPAVDILYVVDNSSSSFNISYTVKQEIAKTISSISNGFDYHILVAPLLASNWESNLTSFQLITSSYNGLTNPTSLNIVSPENLQFFETVTGTNYEPGLARVKSIIDANRSNGVFRTGAYTIVVVISNGDDNHTQYVNGQPIGSPLSDPNFQNYLTEFKKYTKKYADSLGGGENPTSYQERSLTNTSNLLKSQQFRFLSVVAHSNCKSGYKAGTRYKTMSEQIYHYNGTGNSTHLDSYDLCSGEYVQLFSAINSTIKQIILPHKYDHWKITNAGPTDIQSDDILVKKVKEDGSVVNIPESNSDGFEYLGYVTTPTNTRYEPSPGEPQTGHLIKLYGHARVTFPECIIAKTRTPTEYFGFVVMPRKPDLSTVKLKINGATVPKNSGNGWSSYSNNMYVENLNIKVPGPTNAAVTPELNKSGYFLKLNGSAIYTNGDEVEVFYKAQD